jgi:hypothetical protein
METKDIIIFTVVIAVVGFRLYQKYVKKGDIKTGSGAKKTDYSMPSDQKGDDYEPYANK